MKSDTLQAAAIEPQWNGYTIDELKRRRAKALIKREVARAQLAGTMANARQFTSQHGVRALLFNGKEVAGLNKADYALLSFKVIRLVARWWARRKK